MANENYIIGSVSSGTMRKEDLIPTFVGILRKLAPNDDDEFLDSVQGRINKDKDGNYFDSEDATFDLDELFTRLDKQAPPYFYFGENEGDGADYGFWLSEDAIRDFDGLRVDDTSDVPDDYTGEVLHVNDHGNMSLYAAKDGELTEIWAIV